MDRDKILYNIGYIEGAIGQLEGPNDDIFTAIDYIKEELEIKF